MSEGISTFVPSMLAIAEPLKWTFYDSNFLKSPESVSPLNATGRSTGQKVTYANMKVQKTRIKLLFSSFKNIIPSPRYRDLKIANFRISNVFY